MNLTDSYKQQRLKVVLLYGGNSPEHEVSRTSALHVVKSIDLKRYETHLVAIDKSGIWYEFKRDLSTQDQSSLDRPLPIEGHQINPVEYLSAFNSMGSLMSCSINLKFSLLIHLFKFLLFPVIKLSIHITDSPLSISLSIR